MRSSASSSTSKPEKQFAFDRSSNIVHHLGLVATRMDNAIAGNDSLRPFGDAIIKYKDQFLENMKKSFTIVNKKRQQDAERVVRIAENHWLVQPNRLERWIEFKKAELFMFEFISRVEGVTFLPDDVHLKKELASLGNEFAIVLFIPSLDEWSSQITEELKNGNPFTTPSQLPMEDPEPWQLDNERRKSIVDNIMALSRYKMSKKMERVKCYIAFENKNNFGGHFSIYKGDEVVGKNLKNIPNTPLLMQPTISSVLKIIPFSKNIRLENAPIKPTAEVGSKRQIPIGTDMMTVRKQVSCSRK